MTSPLLRLANAHDAKEISRLAHSVSRFFTIHPEGEGADLFFASITPEAIRSYLESPRYVYWVLCDESERIIGAIALRDLSHVYHFFVRSDAQGKGFGRQLWQCLFNFVDEHNETDFLTVNASLVAEAMYTHFGFRPTEPVQEMHGLRYLPMRKNIRP